jgi:hypothetical protein
MAKGDILGNSGIFLGWCSIKETAVIHKRYKGSTLKHFKAYK